MLAPYGIVKCNFEMCFPFKISQQAAFECPHLDSQANVVPSACLFFTLFMYDIKDIFKLCLNCLSLNTCVQLLIAEYCRMTPVNVTAWIEEDGEHGPTAGDTIVPPGDVLNVNDKVQVGDCQQWYKTDFF